MAALSLAPTAAACPSCESECGCEPLPPAPIAAAAACPVSEGEIGADEAKWRGNLGISCSYSRLEAPKQLHRRLVAGGLGACWVRWDLGPGVSRVSCLAKVKGVKGEE